MVNPLCVKGFTVVDGSVTSLKDADYIFLPETHDSQAHKLNINALINTIGKGTLFVEATEEEVSSNSRTNSSFASISSAIAMRGWDSPIERKKLNDLCNRIKQIIVILENLRPTSFLDTQEIFHKINAIIQIKKVEDFFNDLENFLKRSHFSQEAQQELKRIESFRAIIKEYIDLSFKTCGDDECIKRYRAFLEGSKVYWGEYLSLTIRFGSLIRNQFMVKEILTKDNISPPRIVVAGSGHICESNEVYALECALAVKNAMIGKKFLILKPDDKDMVSIEQKVYIFCYAIKNFLTTREGKAFLGFCFSAVLPVITQAVPDRVCKSIMVTSLACFYFSLIAKFVQNPDTGYIEVQGVIKRLMAVR